MENMNGRIALNDPFNAIAYADDQSSRAEILQIICAMPLKERTVLLLHYYGGLHMKQVAIAMGLPVWAATYHLENARGHVFKELGMNSVHIEYLPDEPAGPPVLKQIFDKYAEETHTDEQVQRVLAPVLKMIAEGEFDKPWWYRFKRFMKPSQ